MIDPRAPAHLTLPDRGCGGEGVFCQMRSVLFSGCADTIGRAEPVKNTGG